jgi:hypothetical protein
VDNMAAAGTTLKTNSRVGAPLELSPSPTKMTELRLEGGGLRTSSGRAPARSSMSAAVTRPTVAPRGLWVPQQEPRCRCQRRCQSGASAPAQQTRAPARL